MPAAPFADVCGDDDAAAVSHLEVPTHGLRVPLPIFVWDTWFRHAPCGRYSTAEVGAQRPDSICYMEQEDLVRRLQADAQTADELHARSRDLLISAARAGTAAGLTQREIAAALRRSQPEVSRLLRFHGSTDLGRRLAGKRSEVLTVLKRYGATNPRVFGSVARGTDRPGSDIDLLVDLPSDLSLFALARLERDLSGILDAPVDVVAASTLRDLVAESARQDAVPL
jgi:predicted nucleotidyltransferase/predicted XRE-type DNA-binding protein